MAKATPFAGSDNAADAPKKPMFKKSMVDARELSLDDDAPEAEAREVEVEAEAETGADAIEAGLELSTSPFSSRRSAERTAPAAPADRRPVVPRPAAPAREITEAHVTNVAQALHRAGATAFFHVDGAENTPPEATPAEPARADGAREVVTPASVAEPAPPPPSADFESEFARFKRGELNNRSALELMDRAVEDGRVEQLAELLRFEPETGAEHFARYYFQAEYEALRNRPLQALEILARLDTPDLGDDQRRRVWFKIAVCQRMTRNFAGANDTLQRLVDRFPNQTEYARLKRHNHEQLLAEQSGAAPVLEKTSTLD
jgi:hypothetical protein